MALDLLTPAGETGDLASSPQSLIRFAGGAASRPDPTTNFHHRPGGIANQISVQRPGRGSFVLS
jgi:hypothetical protein